MRVGIEVKKYRTRGECQAIRWSGGQPRSSWLLTALAARNSRKLRKTRNERIRRPPKIWDLQVPPVSPFPPLPCILLSPGPRKFLGAEQPEALTLPQRADQFSL